MKAEKTLPITLSKSEFWTHHLGMWKDSGLSVREYCETESLSRNAFGYWRRKLTSPKPSGNGFVELKFSSQRSDGLIHIRLRKGIELGVVTGTDTRYLADLINALEQC